jgi:uncharacterized protein (TIGR00297 family)
VFLGLILLTGVVTVRLQLLSPGGAGAAAILAIPIFGFGGWMWAVPMLVFFLLSSLLSRVGKARKTAFEHVFEKGGRRDAGQVLANGGVAGAVAIVFAATGRTDLYPLYCTALAAAAADTWATELGTLAKGKPRLVTTFRRVLPGTSGAVSTRGLVSATLGALGVALAGWFYEGTFLTVLLVTFCGVLGSLMDSLLGATLQGQFRCGTCDAVTEKRIHCEGETERVSGWAWMNNDWVNGLSIAGATAVALGVYWAV